MLGVIYVWFWYNVININIHKIVGMSFGIIKVSLALKCMRLGFAL